MHREKIFFRGAFFISKTFQNNFNFFLRENYFQKKFNGNIAAIETNIRAEQPAQPHCERDDKKFEQQRSGHYHLLRLRCARQRANAVSPRSAQV